MKEYKYKINGNEYNVAVEELEGNKANVTVNGKSYQVELDRPAKPAVSKPVARPAAAPAAAAPAAAPAPKAAPAAGGAGIKAPLPGVILDIKVKVGDAVSKGQTIAILEAMKMENNINADREGTVVSINVEKGQSIAEGTDIITLG
ncbi:MAG: biotin/lipoyl-binding protein [Bacteroidaceae bacterium]|nr:biotin/lipoyl-binding protein [Bacteroidaceae bacterium]